MQRIEIQLLSDLDGGPADETVKFALDGTAYEIDLSAKQAADLRAMLAQYREHARRLAPTGRPWRRTRLKDGDGVVRMWAKKHGVECPPIGRVPHRVRAQYEAAQRAGDAFAQPTRSGPSGVTPITPQVVFHGPPL